MKKTYIGYHDKLRVVGYADSEKGFIANQSKYELTGIKEIELTIGEWIADDWLSRD